MEEEVVKVHARQVAISAWNSSTLISGMRRIRAGDRLLTPLAMEHRIFLSRE